MIGFTNHAYYFPHLPVANLRPISKDFPTKVFHKPSTVPFPESIEILEKIYKDFVKTTDVYGSQNLLNYPSFRAYVSNYFGFHHPELEHMQLHPDFGNAVYYVYLKNQQ